MNPRKTMQTKKIPVTGTLQNISPKTMVMVVLLAVMGILWGRVLLGGKKGPAAAQAQEMSALQQAVAEQQSGSDMTLKAVTLPEIPGRNDKLSHDLFSADKWTAFGLGDSTVAENSDVTVDTSGNTEMMQQLKLQRIAERLTLEAVIQDADGNPFQAFVDGKILSVGSILTVKEGPDRYELILEKISEKEVVFTWNDISVVLKMAETFEL